MSNNLINQTNQTNHTSWANYASQPNHHDQVIIFNTEMIAIIDEIAKIYAKKMINKSKHSTVLKSSISHLGYIGSAFTNMDGPCAIVIDNCHFNTTKYSLLLFDMIDKLVPRIIHYISEQYANSIIQTNIAHSTYDGYKLVLNWLNYPGYDAESGANNLSHETINEIDLGEYEPEAQVIQI